MAKNDFLEKRKHPRLFAYHLAKYSLSAPIKDDNPIIASVSDISAGGARLRLPRSLPVSSIIHLSINFPQLPQPLVSLAKIVWTRKLKKTGIYESGLQFIDMGEASKQKITARIEAIKKIIVGILAFLLVKSSCSFAEIIPPAVMAKENAVYAALKDVEMSRALQQAEALAQAEAMALESQGSIWRTIMASTHPFLEFNMAYNDNIYQTADSVEIDYIATVTPSIKFMLGPGKPPNFETSKTHLYLDFGADFIKYTVNGMQRANPYGLLATEIGDRDQKLFINYLFKENTGPASEIEIDTPGLVDWKNFNGSINYEAIFNHLGFDVGYTRNITVYEGDTKPANSYREQFGTLTAFFIPPEASKTRFLAEFDYGYNNYYKSGATANNCLFRKGWLGVKNRITKKISGLAKFGYQTRDYEGLKDRNSFVTDINLEYKQSSANSYFLNIRTGGEESSYRSQNYDKGYYGNLKFRHHFGTNQKLTFGMGFDYAHLNYSTGMVNTTLGGNAELKCSFRKWFNMTLKYTFTQKDSSQIDGGYINNICDLGGELIF